MVSTYDTKAENGKTSVYTVCEEHISREWIIHQIVEDTKAYF